MISNNCLNLFKKILNLQEFKKEIFNGKIFVFNQSDIALNLIQEIKNKIYQNYNGDLDKLHLSNSCEDISTKLVSDLKNTIKFLNLFRDFLKEINFYHGSTFLG